MNWLQVFSVSLVLILAVSVLLVDGFFLPIILGVSAMLVIFFVFPARAETFHYKNGLTIEAPTYEEAAKKCFSQLTGGKYPGEEAGLRIIDLCSNPKPSKTK